MKIDIENPQAVIEEFLREIREGELVKVTRCDKCKFRQLLSDGVLYCTRKKFKYVEPDDFCKYGDASLDEK